MIKRVIKIKSYTLYVLFFILPVICGSVSAKICTKITESPELTSLYDDLNIKKSSFLTGKYTEAVSKYLHYPENITSGDNPFPASQIHTIVSGGSKPFSLLAKANHQAYAQARGIQYRHVDPKEYENTLDSKRPYWLKVFVLNDLLRCDHIPEGSWLMWLDDDIVINDFNHNTPMPDRYIKIFAKEYKVLVTDDIANSRINTGIILIQKNETTRQFIQNWLFYSSHPVHGYESQEKTLHEQEVLRNLLDSNMFNGLNEAIHLVKIIPSRNKDLNINLNTFKRESFVKEQGWDKTITEYEDGDKQWQEGDAFVHCGANDYKPGIMLHTLEQLFHSFTEEKSYLPPFSPDAFHRLLERFQ